MTSNFKPLRPLSDAQDELMKKLLGEVGNQKYKAVSFKMNDVLILLPFSEPYDIFTLMEEDFSQLCPESKKTFSELRIAAQEAALEKYEIMARVTIEKIYNIFAKLSGVNQPVKKQLMQRECELIEQFSFPRECGKALFREAKNNKKRVIITAETIYPKEVITNILEKCGYNAYDGLVIVSEISGCTSESWYQAALEKSGTAADKFLHIGGDVAFDIELPIFKGSKALLLAPVLTLMSKSGRIRGYAEEKKLFDYDKPQYLALHCVFGLYAAYAFDIPQNKVPLSDFCTDGYSIGFLVLGALSLCKDYKPASQLQEKILEAIKQSPEILDGYKDFSAMYDAHFSSISEKYGTDGCQLPLEFIEKCCASADRELIQPYLSADIAKKWAGSVKEPEIIPYYSGRPKKGALSRLADRMFPPDTRVRTIVDGILSKMHK